jgi:hypothetical protein
MNCRWWPGWRAGRLGSDHWSARPRMSFRAQEPSSTIASRPHRMPAAAVLLNIQRGLRTRWFHIQHESTHGVQSRRSAIMEWVGPGLRNDRPLITHWMRSQEISTMPQESVMPPAFDRWQTFHAWSRPLWSQLSQGRDFLIEQVLLQRASAPWHLGGRTARRPWYNALYCTGPTSTGAPGGGTVRPMI